MFEMLADKAAIKSKNHVYNEMDIETMMFDLKGNLICKSKGTDDFLEEILS